MQRQGRYCVELEAVPYSYSIMFIFNTVGAIMCATVCEPISDCMGFNHHWKRNTCEMLLSESKSLNLAYSTDTNFYLKC